MIMDAGQIQAHFKCGFIEKTGTGEAYQFANKGKSLLAAFAKNVGLKEDMNDLVKIEEAGFFAAMAVQDQIKGMMPEKLLDDLILSCIGCYGLGKQRGSAELLVGWEKMLGHQLGGFIDLQTGHTLPAMNAPARVYHDT